MGSPRLLPWCRSALNSSGSGLWRRQLSAASRHRASASPWAFSALCPCPSSAQGGRTARPRLGRKLLRRELRNVVGPDAPLPVICHDNDPSGFKCKLNTAYQWRAGMEILYLPKRTPELMPWDFTLWMNILLRMRSYEDAQDEGWRQPVADYVVLAAARDVGRKRKEAMNQCAS